LFDLIFHPSNLPAKKSMVRFRFISLKYCLVSSREQEAVIAADRNRQSGSNGGGDGDGNGDGDSGKEDDEGDGGGGDSNGDCDSGGGNDKVNGSNSAGGGHKQQSTKYREDQQNKGKKIWWQRQWRR
jgi:hypothetical protein